MTRTNGVFVGRWSLDGLAHCRSTRFDRDHMSSGQLVYEELYKSEVFLR